MSYLRRFSALILAYKWYVLAGLVVVGAVTFSLFRGGPEAPQTAGPRQVKVAQVSDLMNGGTSLSIIAEIESTSEAKISPETGGKVTRVRSSLGAFVGAGQVLVELENSSQRAALMQAEGALDAAKASAGGTQGSAVSTLLTAYGAINSAIEDAVGQMYNESDTSNGALVVSTRDTQSLADMENARKRMGEIVRRVDAEAASISEASAVSELATTEGELREVRTHLDTTLKVLNAAVVREDMTTATIGGYIADVTAARAAITASLSAIISARSALETEGSAISSSAASIKQAEGVYRAALANYEKSLVRSPIAGTVNNFSVKLGDSLAPGQQIAVVSNNGALEAVAYITEEDKARVAVGQKVAIEGDPSRVEAGITGTVTKIAPALDPVTRRIEVRIGLPNTASKTLTNGQSVRVELVKSDAPTPKNAPIVIPITALKMEAERTIVFSVVDGKLAAKEITIGRLSGETVQVTTGLTIDDEIVVDARGLKEGDEVGIAQ